MKRLITILTLVLFAGVINAQEQIFQSFDEASPDTNYWGYAEVSGAHFDRNAGAADSLGWIEVSYDSTNKIEGAASMRVDYSTHNTETWGGYTSLFHWNPDSTGVYDFAAYDTISFSYRNIIPADLPGRVHIRFNLRDVSEHADVEYKMYDQANAEYYYSFHYVLDDSTNEWQQRDIPMVNNLDWDGNGFNRTGWAGATGNDVLDKGFIKSYIIEVSMNGAGEGDYTQGSFLMDKIYLHGLAPKPWLIFNGKTLNSDFGQFTWGNSSLELVDGAGEDPKTNALVFTQGDQWSGGGWNVDPAMDLAARWDLDSLRFKAKTSDQVGTMRLQFESNTGGVQGIYGINFDPITDGEWHSYALALSDFAVWDGKADFDKSAITVFQMMGEGNGVSGNKLTFDFIWTGDPIIDVAPPEAPGLVTASQGTFSNLVTWTDVAGETGESYSVYYSTDPITDVNAAGVGSVALGIGEGEQVAEHILIAPKDNQPVTYYYAVICTDAAGNVSPAGVSDASVTNDAKGVAIINTSAPAGFVADGDLSDWAGMEMFDINTTKGTGWIPANQVIDSPDDASMLVYLAVGTDALYYAFDITDDVNNLYPGSGNTYSYDSPDLFIGLYNSTGTAHPGYKRGGEPDYQIRFAKEGVLGQNPGALQKDSASADFAFVEKFPSGYKVEGKITWAEFAAAGGDSVFVPKTGMKLPIDFSYNDADLDVREGILTYSPNNEDQSWSSPARWTYTWIGDQMTVGVEKDPYALPTQFKLEQNYPNPFNPSTTINYSITEQTQVTVKIYNVLGQQVRELVNEVQTPGVYNVRFDASDLTSGLYVYQISAGKFTDTKKMMLLK